jgi:glucosamine--fructose-6-phosphate aminotransferase (isomerizing)
MTQGGIFQVIERPQSEQTLMLSETLESPEVLRRQREMNRSAIEGLGRRLRDQAPRAVVTLARGSSDNAATFARYLIERRTRTLTSSLSPSVASLYGAMPNLAGTLVLAISQSGRSPDLVSAAEQAKEQGALVVAMVNQPHSPLASLADAAIPLEAGPERSVAATKSFIASLAAILDLICSWTRDSAVNEALGELPGQLEKALALDWNPGIKPLARAGSMYVVGRGHGFGIAQEAALKLKETCAIHAEAYSGAELRHGPMALVRRGFPVLLFGQEDESADGLRQLAHDLGDRDADLLTAGIGRGPGTALPIVGSHPWTAPVLQIASFYRLADSLAAARGLDPDRPPNLSKVTETL